MALDDSDLTLERLRWTTERQQRQIEYDRAFAQRDRSALATTRAQIDETVEVLKQGIKEVADDLTREGLRTKA